MDNKVFFPSGSCESLVNTHNEEILNKTEYKSLKEINCNKKCIKY